MSKKQEQPRKPKLVVPPAPEVDKGDTVDIFEGFRDSRPRRTSSDPERNTRRERTTDR